MQQKCKDYIKNDREAINEVAFLVAVVRACHKTTLNELENELDVKILFLGDGSVSFHSFVWTLQ